MYSRSSTHMWMIDIITSSDLDFRLYDSGENSDLEIVCQDKTFKCHSFLFWSRSKFFAAALKGGFKVGEALTRRHSCTELT